MKKRALDILACPKCRGRLGLDAFSFDKKETIDGLLTCKECRRWYPVINGIPRMLPLPMINKQLLGVFMGKYGKKIPKNAMEGSEKPEMLKVKTSKSFGFQWNVFSEMLKEYESNFLNYVKPLKPSFFKGKLVLDAGCGFGRHTYYAAKYGAEVVGFDLSDAVEAAYKNCRRLDNVHIVQGDIYNLPFRQKFDFIMSIGVLHHLPKPKDGFLRLVGLSRQGRLVLAWLYGREGRWFKIYVVEGMIRQVTKRMPHRLLYYCCYFPAAVYHVANVIYKALDRGPTSGLARLMPFKGYAKFPFKVKHADAFDLLATPVNNYYTREEVGQWAKDARLKDVKITDIDGKSWRLFGRK